MKKFALFILLLSGIIYSCSHDLEKTELTPEFNTETVRIYQDLEERVILEGSRDMNQLFVLYVASFELIMKQKDLAESDLDFFIEKYRDLGFTALISELKENAILTESSIIELEQIFAEIIRKIEIEERIDFIQEITEDAHIESNNDVGIATIILAGYNNILKNNIDSNSSSRNCVSRCIASNSYGFIWWYFHDLYKNQNPWACSPFNFYCLQAAFYANAMLSNWCQAQCANSEPPVNTDPCYGVHCIQGYHCVNGDCVVDPYADPCDDCLPGEHCVNNQCQPF